MAQRVWMVFLLVLGLSVCGGTVQAQQPNMAFKFSGLVPQQLEAVTSARQDCAEGTAAGYDCSNVDLLAFMPLGTFGSSAANDIWGWTDPLHGTEYALIGLNDGTGFVDISDPENPVYLGKLPTHTTNSSWRDIKVYADHAFIVSEANGHGMQVFDLTELRSATNPPVTFSETAHYDDINDVHNIVINEDTGFAYTVGNNSGGTTCSGGLHMVNIQDPINPVFAGCFSSDGYTHDAQCVVYNGPDAAYQGQEICFASNEDTVTIVDVTDKSAPLQLSRVGYPTSRYIHQGWLTDDHVYFYQNDEVDTGITRTFIWDVSDLDDPILAREFSLGTTSRDHNMYTVGDLLYEANYTTGLRVFEISDRENPVEIGFFDTYTPSNSLSYEGAWSNYPYFESGVVIVSSIGEGLFILDPPEARFVASSGTDTANDCTESLNPCATLLHAINQANPGDTLDLAPGTYAGIGLLIEKALTVQGSGVVVE